MTTDEALAEAVAAQVRQGWRVQSQGPTQAQLVKGKPTNHLLHFFLSLFTLGGWLPMWGLVAIFAGEKHRFVQVDADGNVSVT